MHKILNQGQFHDLMHGSTAKALYGSNTVKFAMTPPPPPLHTLTVLTRMEYYFTSQQQLHVFGQIDTKKQKQILKNNFVSLGIIEKIFY